MTTLCALTYIASSVYLLWNEITVCSDKSAGCDTIFGKFEKEEISKRFINGAFSDSTIPAYLYLKRYATQDFSFVEKDTGISLKNNITSSKRD